MASENFIRVNALRNLMIARGWDAVVLRGCDPHGSEYLAPRYQAVTWVSGFTGEAGDLVIFRDEAGLWTDSRYFIQAVKQLEGSGIDLHKTRMPDSVSIADYIAAKGCCTVVCDSLCESADSIAELCAASLRNPSFRLERIPDLIDEVWVARPPVPNTPVINLDEASVGMGRVQKMEWLRAWMQGVDAEYCLLGALDEIAWMLNVRGQDIDFNPVVFSYLLVGQDSVQWFVTKGETADEDSLDTFELLQSEGVSIEAYDAVAAEISRLAACGVKIAYDPATLNGELAGRLAGQKAIGSPVPLKKAVKTAQEIEGMREAHLEDGLAMEKFLYWLEGELQQRQVPEWEAAQYLHERRAEIPGYMGDSFETISAWGPGAALPHYSTPKDDSTLIGNDGLYLVDSGGQYLFGTTDITRTIPVGETTYQQKEDYTLVLKGMIDLSMAVFPYGTAGCQIDALAREPLWRTGRNFGHGTGHGIGFFLCVHEGPQSIRQNFLSQALLPGMITSNEPALYREGSHGIRHENVILCRDAYSNEFGRWLCFETLTLCHFSTDAVLPQLLSREELQWLNDYNEKVYRTYASAAEDDPDFAGWLRKKTLPIG
ncbi:MAG: aminopeptidase P family protein [Bacteroidales bacterium]|nr:aminopeptidase P family protein [Bacteroidales bacterium]